MILRRAFSPNNHTFHQLLFNFDTPVNEKGCAFTGSKYLITPEY